jgi:hypothetical protein
MPAACGSRIPNLSMNRVLIKRAVIFLAAGPVTVALIASLVFAAAGAYGPIVQYIAGALFLMTLPVAAVAGTVDGFLASRFPIALRAPLTAVLGALGAGVIAFGWLHCFFQMPELLFFPLGGAVCMGAYSLMANYYSGFQRQPAISG